MIKRYLLSSVCVIIVFSATRLFSYTTPKVVYPGGVPDISRNELLAAGVAGFPSGLSFAGESIPLEDSQVFKKMDRAFKKHYRQLALNLELMERNPGTMATIDRLLKQHQIPQDFRYLPVIESRLTLDTSHKGAGGYWQLMPVTARSLGLTVNGQADERNDLVKSTEAACKYLKALYRELGSWTLAAAAYNIGQGTLQKELRRQGTGSYYFLDLNNETERYLYRLVAIKELLNHPVRYNALYSRR
ncbi:MAG TPA: lytic transglycosylase domain-containing protein [Anseongella sp.]